MVISKNLNLGTERDMEQWLERGALPMSLPAMPFRILLGAGFFPLNLGTL